MDFNRWYPVYIDIMHDFGWDIEKDYIASLILYKNSINKNTGDIYVLEKLIRGNTVLVIGNGPEFDEQIVKWIRSDDAVVIAADSVVGKLYKLGVIPDVITTDLDGDIMAIKGCVQKGALAIIHAHGDNIKNLSKVGEIVEEHSFITTTQCVPFDTIYNFGGFTDGDRAAFIAREFFCGDLYLYNFNFDLPVISVGKDYGIKKRKLKWAKYLIDTFIKPKWLKI
ncbi:MAG: 6-hydroxymethylpterin diphosphokinase MptE-like protein [Thermoplasmata archaeon]